MDKNELKAYLLQGLSTRKIEKIVNINYKALSRLIYKYELQDLMKYKKPTYDNNFFKKIDTPEKAYILGFLLGDCYLTNDIMAITIALSDKEILEYIQLNLGGNITISTKIDKIKRVFPHASIYIGNKFIINDLKTKFGGMLKIDRHIPIISEKLERYLLLGFFDADGCITWGRRKDRDRIWQKISFTSQLKMLQGIQKILLKNGISTAIKPKGTEKCYVMDFSSKRDVLQFLNLVYDNNELIVLKRKYNKALALRHELGEFGESYVNNVNMVTPSEAF